MAASVSEREPQDSEKRTEEEPVRDHKRARQENVEFSANPEQLARYQRHSKVKTEEKNVRRRRKVQLQERLNDEAVKRLAASELLLTETPGYLEAEGDERTFKFRQSDIIAQLDTESASKVFDLQLSYGPYRLEYTRNGKHMLIGGKKGSLSVVDCQTMAPVTEINVRETIHDVCFLQNHTMWAAAQKKYVHIYDQSGIELHCLREHMATLKMEFLPYHYLLTTIGRFGQLRWLDVSTGLVAAAYKTNKGPCSVMCQNRANAVINLGHTSGSVSLWTPNVGKPIVEFLAHGGALTALNSVEENYLVTAGLDGTWKIFDTRKFQPLHSFHYFGSAPTSIDGSQTGLIGLGFGPHVQIWKDCMRDSKPKMPYLTHEMNGNVVESLKFRPFEDFCGIGSAQGIHSIVVPGSCLANYDSHAANPYETKKQRQEAEVRGLLEKLPATTITFDPRRIGLLDEAPKNVIIAEQEAAKMRIVEAKENNTRREKKKIGTAARAANDRKKFAEMTQKLAQKRQIEEKLAERGSTLEEKLAVEETTEEKETESSSKEKKPTDALDRFRKREKAHYS